MSMQWVQVGPGAILLYFAERPDEDAFRRGRAIVAELEAHPPSFLREFTPAYTSVLLELNLKCGLQLEMAAKSLVAQLEKPAKRKYPPGPIRKIPVVYDGPDLDRVAHEKKLTVKQVIAYHSKQTYWVHFLGFAPGFPYLGGLHKKLHTPRLDAPRPRVPAGSVAIGGEHSGIYSVETPGGWNIIGRTNVNLFDPAKAEDGHEAKAFFLSQGDRVRFVPVKEFTQPHSPTRKSWALL